MGVFDIKKKKWNAIMDKVTRRGLGKSGSKQIRHVQSSFHYKTMLR